MDITITIVGGAGAMGRWFSLFFSRYGEVTICDPRVDAESVAKELGVKYEDDMHHALSGSDVVLISVPIEHAEDMIRKAGEMMKPGSLLMDITSVKRGVVEVMDRVSVKKRNVEMISAHPMFGPGTPDLKNKLVILIPVSTDHWLPVIRKIFEDEGAMIEILSAEEHDKIMAVTQGLIHFIYIALGKTIEELEFDVDKSRRYMGTVCKITMDFVGRILAQDPHLYAMIQMSHTDKIRDVFIAQCNHLSELVKKKDCTGLIEELESAAKHFSLEDALRESDALIYNLDRSTFGGLERPPLD